MNARKKFSGNANQSGAKRCLTEAARLTHSSLALLHYIPPKIDGADNKHVQEAQAQLLRALDRISRALGENTAATLHHCGNSHLTTQNNAGAMRASLGEIK